MQQGYGYYQGYGAALPLAPSAYQKLVPVMQSAGTVRSGALGDNTDTLIYVGAGVLLFGAAAYYYFKVRKAA